jgi:hypothetical protein
MTGREKENAAVAATPESPLPRYFILPSAGAEFLISKRPDAGFS